MKRFIPFLFFMPLCGCEGDSGDKGWWILFGFPIMGFAYLIHGEITRPRPAKLENEKIKKVLDLYQKAGYITYHVSVHTPELFFTYLDKGKDENNDQRMRHRVYVDIYKKRAYSEWSGKDLPLPIPF